MKKTILALIILSIFGIFTAEETFGKNTLQTNRRQKKPGQRIKPGIKNKRLTAENIKRLARRQTAVRKSQRRVESAGKVVWKERAELHKSSRRTDRVKRRNKSRN